MPTKKAIENRLIKNLTRLFIMVSNKEIEHCTKLKVDIENLKNNVRRTLNVENTNISDNELIELLKKEFAGVKIERANFPKRLITTNLSMINYSNESDYILFKGIFSIIIHAIQKYPWLMKYPILSISKDDLESFTGQQFRGENLINFLEKMDRLNKGQEYFLFNGYDEYTQLFGFDISRLMLSYEDTIKNSSFLMHSEIVKVKDKISIMIIEQIELFLMNSKDNIIDINFSELIDNTPMLKQRLEDAENTKYPTQYKNQVLKRTFNKVIELIESKTDICISYNNFVKPTTTTLCNWIITVQKRTI